MLTDIKVRQAKAKAKPYKLADAQGLYLYISTTSAKSWRYDYRHSGKRFTLTHGPYPQVSLNEARERHALARKTLERGENPALIKQRVRQDALAAAGDTFKAIAEVWFAGKSKARSKAWQESTRRWLNRDAYPALGARIVRDIR
ncbi:MAG TPA: integrase arm-type DNA-binding domain-containing protein, partial [Burkholderiales bacterium]|nr:integrase arm-type DNA-binding domain-containing protein [Burkholderiales bacterium]